MNTETRITTSRDVRRAFYAYYPYLLGEPDQPLVNQAFAEFIDALHRAGIISDRLVRSVTLEG